MNIKLSLRQHCIETAIKKGYNISISDYFRSEQNQAGEIEENLELFRDALETFDFGRLRSRHPALRGQTDAAVLLFRDESGRLRITINGEDIEP